MLLIIGIAATQLGLAHCTDCSTKPSAVQSRSIPTWLRFGASQLPCTCIYFQRTHNWNSVPSRVRAARRRWECSLGLLQSSRRQHVQVTDVLRMGYKAC